jgi:predicted permease
MLALLSALLPACERAEWRREWEAELESDRAPGGSPAARAIRRLGRLAAAAEDAMRLGIRRSAPPGAADLLRDVRFAARGLARAPLFTAAVALTLALGTGANASMFAVVKAALVEPLPYPAAEAIVRLRTVWLPDGGDVVAISTGDFDDLVERSRRLEDLSLRIATGLTYLGEEPLRIEAAGVSSGYFRLFGTVPHVGRYLGPGEDRPGHEPVVVLSHGFWQRVFGGDRSLIGRSIGLDGHPYVVVGVAEPGFRDPASDVDLWTSRPAYIQGAQRDQPWLMVFGRLAPGVTLEDAVAEVASVSADLAREHPATNAGHALSIEPLAAAVAEPVRPALIVLAAVVGLLLLVTCVNVANLILVRSTGRDREMAVRMSLGAGRARLTSQLLVEGLVLALLGGASGVLVAGVATRAFVAMGSPGLPRLAEVRLDGQVLLFSLLLSAGTGILFGLVPLAQVRGGDTARNLREGGRSGAGRGVRRLRRALVVSELAMSGLLMVGAGLLVRSLVRLSEVETGVRTQGVLVFQVAHPAEPLPTPAGLRDFYERTRLGLERLPGVEAVGGVSVVPFTYNRMYRFRRESGPSSRADEEPLADLRFVEADYFDAVGIPLLAGRLLDERDAGNAPPALVIDEEMAERYFPTEDPLGQLITVPWGPLARPHSDVTYEVVGLVGSIRHRGPADPSSPTLYLPRAHDSTPYWENLGLWITVRTAGDPLALATAVRQVVLEADGTVPVVEISSFDSILDRHVSGTRYRMLLIGAFALLALALAGVGIGGVVAYAVAQRAPELGVRQALGARSADVVRLVLREGVTLAAWGVAIGLLVAVGASQALRGFLYGVGPGDPVTYVAVGVLLTAAALAAAWIPARRAARVQPADALRGNG